jgi:Lhr-like helicase
MKEILEKALKEYNKGRYNGLCSALLYSDISREEMKEFLDYLKKNTPRFKIYYKYARNRKGERYYARTLSRNGAFYWHPDDKQSRIDWLNKHIKLNS